jgi:hypothetical protein
MYPKSSSPSWENMPRKLKLELWLDKKHGFMDTKIVHDIKKKTGDWDPATSSLLWNYKIPFGQKFDQIPIEMKSLW